MAVRAFGNTHSIENPRIFPLFRCITIEDKMPPKVSNGTGVGGKPRRDVLASVRMASMDEVSRAALPAGMLDLGRRKSNIQYS